MLGSKKIRSRPQQKGKKTEVATSPLPSRGPKRGRKCYVTPAFSGIPNAKDGEQELSYTTKQEKNINFGSSKGGGGGGGSALNELSGHWVGPNGLTINDHPNLSLGATKGYLPRNQRRYTVFGKSQIFINFEVPLNGEKTAISGLARGT